MIETSVRTEWSWYCTICCLDFGGYENETLAEEDGAGPDSECHIEKISE